MLFPVALLALLPLAISCDGSSDNGDGEQQKISPQEVGKKIGEAANATADYVAQEWKEFADSMRDRLDKADERIKELRKKAEEATGDAKKELERAAQRLAEKQKKLREQLKELGDRSGAAWEEAEEGFRKAMAEFEKESKEAVEKPVPTTAPATQPAAP